MSRVFCLALLAASIAAFFMRPAQGHELPCFMKDSTALTALAPTRGYGLSEGGLIKLSVNRNGTFILTVSPPGQPVICIFVMGENWEWVLPKPAEPVRDNVND